MNGKGNGNDGNNGKARVISIISGKGGVGKTTLVSNMSVLLVHNFKKHVLAVDANITTANLGIHMGLLRVPTTLHNVLEEGLPISNAIYDAFGVDVIPAAHSIGNEKSLRRLRSKIRPLLPYYDFVILDSSPGLGLEARLALQIADELLLVTNPDLSAVTEAIKMVELARKKKIPVTGIVLNKVAGRDYEVKIREIEETCGEKVIVFIPEDVSVQKSLSMRTPVAIYNPGCRASRAMESAVRKIVTGEKTERGFFEKLALAASFLSGEPTTATGPPARRVPGKKTGIKELERRWNELNARARQPALTGLDAVKIKSRLVESRLLIEDAKKLNKSGGKISYADGKLARAEAMLDALNAEIIKAAPQSQPQGRAAAWKRTMAGFAAPFLAAGGWIHEILRMRAMSERFAMISNIKKNIRGEPLTQDGRSNGK